MENRENVVGEYFKLRMMLNRANALKNEVSQLKFAIYRKEEDYILWVTLLSVARPQGLELCRRSPDLKWLSSNFSGLLALEEYCASFLNENFSATLELSMAAAQLEKELRSLGVPS